MADVIGVFGDVLGIYSFFADLFNRDPVTTVVRVSAALNGANGDLENADGAILAEAWNQHREFIGWSEARVNSGGFFDLHMARGDVPSNQQAPYIRLFGFNDAICIPYISVTFSDGNKYGWVGDWADECGLDAYYSDVFVSSGNHAPMCAWLDQDHSNGLLQSALEIHLPSFATDDTSLDPQSFCRGPAFHSWEDWEGPPPNAVYNQIFKKRAPYTRDNRLVVSQREFHNATKLCEKPNSRGPDFVSLVEGVYCNMETRETLRLCDSETQLNCFNLDSKMIQRDVPTVTTNFTKIIRWGD
ncbi:hypothetical protein F4779DRAFT_467554 [Xylariaceae sp. FL0662B]|nr:hypothetical protein F4779DRAFT_467554 [Xylariaceae sp. FL0662B]